MFIGEYSGQKSLVRRASTGRQGERAVPFLSEEFGQFIYRSSQTAVEELAMRPEELSRVSLPYLLGRAEQTDDLPIYLLTQYHHGFCPG
jgi:hypothetical protein